MHDRPPSPDRDEDAPHRTQAGAPVAMSGRRHRFGVLRVVFGVAGTAFLVVAFMSTWERADGWPVPSLAVSLAAGLLVVAALLCLARAWYELFPAEHRSGSLVASFFESQLGRYIPGVVWQALGQIGLAARSGSTIPQASASYGVHAAIEAAAGATIGALLVVAPGVPTLVRIGSAALLLLIALLRRRWLAAVLDRVGGWIGRPSISEHIPPQSGILRSFVWTAATFVASAGAFAILLRGLGGDVAPARAIAAFCFAWTVGFLAIPFPAGIGIREAALVAALQGDASAGLVIAASLCHRLVNIVVEVLLIVSTRIAARRSGDRGAATG